MGACCSKNSGFKTISASSNCKDADADLQQYSSGNHRRHDEEEEDNVIRNGDFGASVRVSGSSAFVSMDTQKGQKLDVNQDAITVWEDFIGEKDVTFCGVFDGHGPNGHNVSRKVRDNLPSKLANNHKTLQRRAAILQSMEDIDGSNHGRCSPVGGRYCENPVFDLWKNSFVRAFKEMDKDLHYDPVMDTYNSGATGITLVKQGDDLMIGNLGDSRAVLCTRGEKGGEVIPIQLTVDLKPSLPREAERIMYCSGRVFALDDEPEVLRVWQAEKDTPGLAMSRAFGDFCLKDYGLISIPQLFYRKLTERDEFVVLASDGVWNVLSNLEVVRIVSSAKSRSMAAKLLVACASRAWESRYPNAKVDDIAVVCLFFKPPNGSPVRSVSNSSSLVASTPRRRSLSGYYKVNHNEEFNNFQESNRSKIDEPTEKEELKDDDEPKLKSILRTRTSSSSSSSSSPSPGPRLERVRKVRFREIVEIDSDE